MLGLGENAQVLEPPQLAAELTAEGRDGAPIHAHHLFIVRPLAGRKPHRILQVAATGSWTAYNTWGGSNHYQGITGPKRNQFATSVSTERPWCRGFVVLPEDAPRVPLEISTPAATVTVSGVPATVKVLDTVAAAGHGRPAAGAIGLQTSHRVGWVGSAGLFASVTAANNPPEPGPAV